MSCSGLLNTNGKEPADASATKLPRHYASMWIGGRILLGYGISDRKRREYFEKKLCLRGIRSYEEIPSAQDHLASVDDHA